MTRTAIASFAAALLLATAAAAEDHQRGGGFAGPHSGQHAAPQGTPSGATPMQRGGYTQFQQNFNTQNFEQRGNIAPRASGPVPQEQPRNFDFTNERHENFTPHVYGPAPSEQNRNSNFSNERAPGPAISHTVTSSHRLGTRPSNWNQRPRSFDPTAYARNFVAPRQFHDGAYRRPNGWYNRRWAYGEYLPAAFWVGEYWINDWWQFDLPIPPYGYEWVRYGDDALLIDTDTGEILQVEYGVFY